MALPVQNFGRKPARKHCHTEAIRTAQIGSRLLTMYSQIQLIVIMEILPSFKTDS